MLLIDTNILIRAMRGRARPRVQALARRGVRLATTDRNAFELYRKLTTVLQVNDLAARALVNDIIAPL